MENHIRQLFVDFILNRCNPAQIKQVQELVETGAYEQEWRAALEETEQHFSGTEHGELPLNEGALFERINLVINSGPVIRKKGPWLWMAAASLLLMVAAGLWLNQSNEKISVPAPITKVKQEYPKDTTHKWVKLPDGSSVQLNRGSYLEYADSFEGKALREVRLIGEGYFDIKHDARHPFVIHTGRIKTTVLGTAFNISAYKANQAVTVTVTRGKVKVEDEKRVLAVLTPDQQLAWDVKKPEPVKAKVNAEAVTEWKKHDLIMDDITLEQAAQMIATRYGVKTNFKNEKMKNCRFTAAFLNRDDLTQVLKVTESVTGATITLKNNLVTFDGQGCYN
ncbi:transmembrane sensor [Pedobacter africanus]|uniref:Ferric-dicitrate binding protein FerR (Iron transport regulator) n=1 Tax=Pedobacter africanus TaxID=151894 RepID=A0ACC6L2U1_9SPHI|nr:FecR domain-containing protein [Pedobacter africanus]MDR6785747.1 ferric-dicitrate binding protein FerR (iron transport regulator) [Pedobacter africanus]